jgi:hypothetical protein
MRAIVELRDAVERGECPAAPGHRAFHERLMRMGTIPAVYFRGLFVGGAKPG